MDSIYFNDNNFNISFSADFKLDEEDEVPYIDKFDVFTINNKKLFTYESPVRLFINMKTLKVKDAELNLETNMYTLSSKKFSRR